MIEEPPLLPTWSKYIILFRYVSSLSIRDKRAAFMAMRQVPGANADLFFPRLGITAGEFCVFHTLAHEEPRRSGHK